MRLISVLGVVLLSLSMLSCEGLLGPDGGQVHQRVQVSMSVRKPVPAALINGLAVTGPSQFGTSLIVLVPEGTESTPIFEQIAGVDVLDRQLLDLATSSVSLGVPLGVPVLLLGLGFRAAHCCPLFCPRQTDNRRRNPPAGAFEPVRGTC